MDREGSWAREEGGTQRRQSETGLICRCMASGTMGELLKMCLVRKNCQSHQNYFLAFKKSASHYF